MNKNEKWNKHILKINGKNAIKRYLEFAYDKTVSTADHPRLSQKRFEIPV